MMFSLFNEKKNKHVFIAGEVFFVKNITFMFKIYYLVVLIGASIVVMLNSKIEKMEQS